jgi:hypothetical protein
VSDAEARRTLTGRMKAGPVEWRNLTLFVVKDFGDIRVSTLKPQQGAWPLDGGLFDIDEHSIGHNAISPQVHEDIAATG